MNLKTKMKNFFTLTRKANGGFTLVELIVVIAILAILGGVAVPAYSGYVKKANMQADRTLISDVEHALTLAGYSGTFAEGEGGYILLSVNGVEGVEAGSALEKALIATFGTDYADTLILKYDGWGSNGLFDNLAPDVASGVKNSSYLTGNRSDFLLSDVETMTDMAQDVITVFGSSLQGTTLNTLFGADVLNETGKKYGVGEDDWTVADWDAWANENKTAYSNLLVLAAADESQKYMCGLRNGERYQLSEASTLILGFSSYYAFASTNDDFSKTLDTYLGHLNGTAKVEDLNPINSVSDGAAWYTSLQNAANQAGYSTYTTSDDNFTDQMAFLSIMSGIGDPSEEQAARVAADLSNSNLFTSGVVNGMYNDYMNGVEALSDMYVEFDENGDYTDYSNWSLGLGSGNVAILLVQKNDQIVVVDSLPEVN